MINLVMFICSLIIQVGAVDLPIILDLSDFEYLQDIRSGALSSSDPAVVFWGDCDLSEVNTVVIQSYNNPNLYNIYFDYKKYNSSVTSQCRGGSYNNGNVWGQNTVSLDILFKYYYRFSYNLNTNTVGTGSIIYDEWQNGIIPTGYPTTGRNNIICGLNFQLYSESGAYVYTGEYVYVPVVPEGPLSSFGSLNISGHSSDGNPLEDLKNFSWSTSNGSVLHSGGHSLGVSSSSATFDFSNATQNLLGQIVDNTNDLLFNGHSLGEEIKTINANIINGASAIFNGISQFNNNFVSTYVYDSEKVDEALTNSSMFAFANATTDMTESIINESDVLLDYVHDMEEKQDLIIFLDLTKWRVPVYSSSTGVNTSYVKPYNEVVQIDFSFLKETKSIWQPILLGILYLSLFLSIYFDLPNILRGANG